jgi:hypothetical protein
MTKSNCYALLGGLILFTVGCNAPVENHTDLRDVMKSTTSQADAAEPKIKRFCKTDIPLLEKQLTMEDRFLIANPEEVAYLIQRKGTRGPIDPKYTSGDMPVYRLTNEDEVNWWMMCVYHKDQGQALLIPYGQAFVPPAADQLGRRRWLPLEGPWPEEEPEEK